MKPHKGYVSPIPILKPWKLDMKRLRSFGGIQCATIAYMAGHVRPLAKPRLENIGYIFNYLISTTDQLDFMLRHLVSTSRRQKAASLWKPPLECKEIQSLLLIETIQKYILFRIVALQFCELWISCKSYDFTVSLKLQLKFCRKLTRLQLDLERTSNRMSWECSFEHASPIRTRQYCFHP